MKSALDQRKRCALPRYGNYNCVFRYLLEKGVNVKCILPPEITRKTVDIGARNSPDFVCVPFKTLLGSMIEALEAGADTLIMPGGACRLGYYGELHEQILRDMGYEFEMINIAEYGDLGKNILKIIKRINPKAKVSAFLMAALDAVKMLDYVDEITAQMYQNCGFEINKGEYKKAYNRFLSDMFRAESRNDIEDGYKRVKDAFAAIAIDKPEHPLRVGLLGEYFTIMDPPSNLYIEEKLADMGVEVWRWLNLSNRQFKENSDRNLHVRIRDLCRYDMGPTSTETLWSAKKWAEDGFDGLIHVKSANCTPEIDLMPMLQRVGQEHKLPILFQNYDTQTSDVGLMTRLEAFYDMISMKKRV
ncbi:MAG: hypothetical protein Q4C54_04370 [Clostridia bacterium]|nr:hypothetical protein [Clostridia bacterium]